MARDMILVRVRADLSGMAKAERKIESGVNNASKKAAEALVDDIRSHWTAPGPSSPGEAPAILTGNLDSTVRVDKQGRDLLGRFSSDAEVFFVRIDTAAGDNPLDRGDYATVLEDKRDRAFFEPAVERLANIFPFFYKRLI